VRKIVSLNESQDLVVAPDKPYEFELIHNAKALRLRVQDRDWIRQIQTQIDRCREEDKKRSSASSVTSTGISSGASASNGVLGRRKSSLTSNQPAILNNIRVTGLNQRAKVAVYMLKSESTYVEYLRVCLRVLVKPLDDLTHGAALGKNLTNSNSMSEADRGRSLFDTKTSTFSQLTEGTLHRIRVQQQSKVLQTAEMGKFLQTFPSLENVTETIVAQLEARTREVNDSSWEKAACIGDIFLDLKSLSTLYTSYASAYDEAFHVLSSNMFSDYVASIAQDLAPLTLDQHLKAPFDAMTRYQVQLKTLLDLTPPEHRDYSALKGAVELTEVTGKKMEQALENSRMYRRIRAIRDSLVVVGFSQEALETLVSSDRKLIREGRLQKVCRSKNKYFQFWLFNDYILYATPLPAGKYQFNRIIQLATCKVQESTTDHKAFEVLSAEKSFAVLAESMQERDQWVLDIRQTQKTYREEKGIQELSKDGVGVAAPIWDQDSGRSECSVCHQGFSMLKRRKHHCRKCGSVVCDRCSGNRLVLPNIHKTNKQRVCNSCVKGGHAEAMDENTLRQWTGSRKMRSSSSTSSERGLEVSVIIIIFNISAIPVGLL